MNGAEPGFYAVEGPDGIKRLHLGPMEVEWHSLDGRVSLDIQAGGKSVHVYSSRTGRSLRVFRDGEELK